jgi:GH15 family glucan-1,4-alpha-glucosidase
MLETDPAFRPVRIHEGYLPLEDLGLIGDGATVALVGLDGSIPWLCLPRFDSEPVFCGLLDRDRGGHFTIVPDELTQARQRYEADTGVLVTELRSPTGLVRLTDALALRSGADLTDDVPGGRGSWSGRRWSWTEACGSGLSWNLAAVPRRGWQPVA